MGTFLTAANDLLDYVNRPSSEMLTQAKREINNTLRLLQRHHNFKYAEKLAVLTYASNILTYNLTDVCGGLLKRLESVQLLPSASATKGVNLPYYNYKQIQYKRNEFQGKFQGSSEANLNELTSRTDQRSHEKYVTDNFRYWAFTVGSNFGLYPTPQAETYIMLHVTYWTKDLVTDSATHYLLDFCHDAVVDIASARFTDLYLKDDSRARANTGFVQAALDSIKSWDSEVAESFNA
jgi:hypothetical protein